MGTPWVVVVRGGALGDFILTLPLLRELGRGGRRLCLVTRPAYRDLLPPGCSCDRFLDIQGRALMGLFTSAGPVPDRAVSGMAQCGRRSPTGDLRGARDRRTECASHTVQTAVPPFLKQPCVPDDVAEMLSRADLHLFSRPDSAWQERLGTLGVARVVWHDPRPQGPPHVAVRYLEEAGIAPPPEMLSRPQWPLRPRGTGLWLHPGSGSVRKNWPVPLFARFAAAWQRLHGDRAPVIVSIGEADTPLLGPCEQAFAAVNVRPRWVCQPDLRALRDDLVTSTALYIGNDSGVTHLAAALGIPTIALFRRTDPRLWRPLGRVLVLPHDLGTARV